MKEPANSTWTPAAWKGGKAGIQLWQGGLAVGMDQTAMILLSSDTELAPGFTVPGISKEMIAEVVDCYGKAAARAVAAPLFPVGWSEPPHRCVRRQSGKPCPLPAGVHPCHPRRYAGEIGRAHV